MSLIELLFFIQAMLEDTKTYPDAEASVQQFLTTTVVDGEKLAKHIHGAINYKTRTFVGADLGDNALRTYTITERVRVLQETVPEVPEDELRAEDWDKCVCELQLPKADVWWRKDLNKKGHYVAVWLSQQFTDEKTWQFVVSCGPNSDRSMSGCASTMRKAMDEALAEATDSQSRFFDDVMEKHRA